MVSVRARRAARLMATAGAGALLAAGLSGAGAAAAATQDADLTVPYQCAFPAGPQRVTVRYQASFPAAVRPGGQVKPGAVTATLTVPRAAVADLDAAEVGGTVQVTGRTTRNGTTAKTTWPAMAIEPAAVPDAAPAADPAAGAAPATIAGAAPLTLKASGEVPAATAGKTGDLAFGVGALGLGLAPADAGKDARETPVACTPEKGSGGLLATVPVTADATAKAPKAVAEVPPGQQPPGCKDLNDPGWMIHGCVYMNGFANVRKLGGATILNDPAGPSPALTNVQYKLTYPSTGLGVGVEFRFHEPLRSKATFLTFGFMPTTATMEMDQIGLGTENSEPYAKGNTRQHIETKMRVRIRLYDVTVNGTPLDVGEHCQSARPVDITLGDSPAAPITNIVNGGTLVGSFDIPPFQGCGTAENLDPLFTDSVSGTDNYLKITQGTICGKAVSTCPPAMPELKR